MSQIRTEHQIGRRNLVGRRAVSVSVAWRAEHSSDLAQIGEREPTGIRLSLDGTSQSNDFSAVLDIEHARIVRDLLTEAIESTGVREFYCEICGSLTHDAPGHGDGR